MLYKPNTNLSLWDTWLYHHNETYYLYYLAQEPTEQFAHGVGLATSDDGVHWHEHGLVLHQDENASGIGTGAIWKATDFEKSGRFIMNYSVWFEDGFNSQTIRFAESSDLVHWKLLGVSSEFKADSRWYEAWPTEKTARWDSIYPLTRQGGGLYGYWTANMKTGEAGAGFGETVDGIHWVALPPPKVFDDTPGEVGAVEKIGDNYYMLCHGGFSTLVSSQVKGPFYPVKKNRQFLKGSASYFVRFFPSPDGLLTNHQTWTLTETRARNPQGADWLEGITSGLKKRNIWFAPLKRAVLDSTGILRMMYWEGNEKLKGNQLTPKTPEKQSSVFSLIAHLNMERGGVLEADVQLPAGEKISRGICFKTDADRDACILLCHNGVARIGSVKSDGSDFQKDPKLVIKHPAFQFPPFDQADWDCELDCGNHFHIKFFVRQSMLELYINDVLIRAHSFRENLTGDIGILNNFSGWMNNIKIWEMSL